jgi:hypothetical protein
MERGLCPTAACWFSIHADPENRRGYRKVAVPCQGFDLARDPGQQNDLQKRTRRLRQHLRPTENTGRRCLERNRRHRRHVFHGSLNCSAYSCVSITLPTSSFAACEDSGVLNTLRHENHSVPWYSPLLCHDVRCSPKQPPPSHEASRVRDLYRKQSVLRV